MKKMLQISLCLIFFVCWIRRSYESRVETDFFEGLEVESLMNISTCVKQFQKILEGSLHGEFWALKFLDSWGKLPPGIMLNNTVAFGDFDECISIVENIDGESIHGKYCLLKIPFLNFVLTDPVSIGMCLPSSCNVVEIQDQILEALGSSNSEAALFSQELCSDGKNYGLNAPDIVCISIFGIIGVAIILSTLYEFITEQMMTTRFEAINIKKVPKDNRINADEVVQREILVAFSLLQNCRELFTTTISISSSYAQCLYGIWSLAILCVIFDGSYSGVFKWNYIPYTLLSFRTIFYIDTFLLLTAFSMTSDVFLELSMKNSVNVPKLYINQYIRLTSVLGMVILFCAMVFKYIGNGPVWNMEVNIFEPCQRYWWSALTHIQMYVNPRDMCLEQTWYLSVNMQLTILTVLILYPLYKWRLKCIWILPFLIAICMTGTYFKQAEYMASQESIKFEDLKFDSVYGALPWLVGILLGYVLFSIRASVIAISKHIIRLGWISVPIIMGATIYFTVNYKRTGDVNVSVEIILIKLFSRFLWSLCIGWIIFACSRGYGGVVNKFLCLAFWQPLSKLCTTMYIIHNIVHIYARASTRTSMLITEYDRIQYFWGNFGVTLILSIICVLAFEYPVLNIESLIWRQIEKNFQRQTYDVQTPTRSQSGSVQIHED